jgi:glycosyltransferase EpsF
MAALDVFVSPALREGFGLVALEAQAAGTPTVVSTGFPRDIDMQLGIVQIISDKDAGIWADAVLLAAQLKCPPSEKISDAIKTMGYSASENTRRIERAWRDPSFIPGVKA